MDHPQMIAITPDEITPDLQVDVVGLLGIAAPWRLQLRQS